MGAVLRAYLAIFGFISTIAAPATSQTYPTEYDKGRGIEVVSWCTSTGAKSRLLEKLGKGSECRKAQLRHGNKSENELGLSAIKEICLGNYDIAMDLIRACDCHNPGDFQSVWNDWDKVVAWANRHPYCDQWNAWKEQAQACRESGDVWNDEARRCDPHVEATPTPAPYSFAVIGELVCVSPGGDAMRIYPQIGSHESCDAAARELASYVAERDRCAEQNSYWRLLAWRQVSTGVCRLP